MAAIPQILPEKYVLEIVAGPDKGAQFQVFAGDIKIGRGENNDIVLNDPRCSREHAVLKITTQAIFIEDLGSQNGVTVDGQKSARSFISNGSKVSLGSTTFIFRKVANTPSALETKITSTLASATPQVQSLVSKVATDPKKMTFYIIVVGVVVVALFFLTMPTTVQKSAPTPLTPDQEIQDSQKRQETLLKEQMQSGKASRQYLDAQASFTKGLRDFREGLYKNAVSSFSATLSIYPDHPTAKRYLRLAQMKLDEKVQLTMQDGNRFMDQQKYQNAKVAFSEVMLLVGDPQNKIYQEAKEKYNECVLILRESF
jgi:pSer/pThr/pTyr-binding forkhead associated (FHA) protein